MGWSQLWTVTAISLRSLPRRAGSSAVAMVGIAGVVGIFVAVLSIGEGFRSALASTGDPATVLVLRGGNDTELTSSLVREDARVIADVPGLARGSVASGVRGNLASRESYFIVDLPKRATGTTANVPLRGVEGAGIAARPGLELVDGRWFRPGSRELTVGRGAQGIFSGLDLGGQLEFGGGTWTVVGTFDSGGTAADSEIWTDVKVAQPAFRRNAFQSVYLRLADPEGFAAVKDALEGDPRLDVKVIREQEYYAGQSETLYTLIRVLGGLVAVIMGLAAIFGAFNTIYTAVSSRTREIATLRALGFHGVAVVVSILAEALVLGLIGGVVGGLVAYVGFNGYQTSTINFQSFSQVTFAFRITPELLAQGVAYALAIGLLGGLFPAVRAARMPIARALRQL